ncbi:uncharacterized protein N7483_003596 [Penicillium malachiteum]|uniref:uncharacterized protein n=1 Tax=Penicillium malachiteum TaxID=1324776 RepID=UPI0025497B69|nr:uncharacterized protein N7483_003596 [Penicillium malachiteum]KAJ5729088.1 hypothetical protein N7483_003596 [Penicillium malachiteum]
MIYSQGFNFNSYVEKGVDPRTGQYNCILSLYEVPAGVRNSPPLNLSLHFNPLGGDDVGLGRGWSFGGLSSYDQPSRTLILSTGENYKVQESTSSVLVTDQKLQSFRFQKTSTTSYRVTLKSGQVELLSNFNNRTSVSVPIEIYGANGHSLQLSWVFSGTQPRLSKIQAGSQDLVEIVYNDSTQITTVTRGPGTAEAATFTLMRRNGQLAELRLPLQGSPAWNPTGATETISYRAGFRLPSGAPVLTIPHVISHTARPFHDQPAIQTTYTYSDHNFLGFGGGRNWSSDGDNLYLTPADYEYTSTVQVVGGTTTRHVYNKFHLQLSTQQQKGVKQLTQTTTYYARSNTAFENQPAQYQLPQTQETTYRDTATGASRNETTRFTFDEWGNETSETPPRVGSQPPVNTILPPARWTHPQHVKLETVIPASSGFPTPTRAHSYTYLKLPTATAAPADYFVASDQRLTREEGSQPLTITEYTYVNEPESADHGRRQQQLTRVFNQPTTIYQFEYRHWGSTELTETITTTSFDGQTTQEETTSSLISGLTLATKNQAGTETTHQHDAIGRVTHTITAPGTAFEARKQHEYAVLEDAVGWQVTVTDSKGVQTRYFTDGMDRVVRVESQDDDAVWDQHQTYTGTFRVVQERRYNALDQCIEEVDIDWLRANGTPTSLRTTRSLEYDDWGELYKVTKNGGAAHLSVTDPIALTQTVGNEGEGQTRSQLNTFQTPSSEALVRRDGSVECTIEYAYDGLGRRCQMTDGLGRATQYSYDSFDRVVKTTWPDGHAIVTQYAAESTAALPVAIDLQGSSGFSTQSFDGLERPLRTTVGGRTTSNTYEGVAPVPAQVITPKGGRSERTYEPSLDYALTGRITSDGTESYEYDKQTGSILQLGSSLAAARLSYYPSHLLSKETIQTADGTRALEYVYSQAGKLQEYTDVHGKQHTIQYDASGRRQEIKVGTLTTRFSYDQADRVITTSSRVTLTTNIEYDEFGREIHRKFWTEAALIFQTTQSYGATGLVTTRDRRDDKGTLVRQEAFEYDSLSRLVDYQCQGTQPPVDEQGRALRRQRFTFNDYNGLAQIQTIFADGSDNTQVYTYSAEDPTQLISIYNTHSNDAAAVNLEYDENGCMTRDEHGRTLVYNASRFLSVVYDSQNQLLCEYGYDATDRLVRQSIPNEPDTEFSYRGGSLIAVTKGDHQTSFISDGNIYWGTVQQQGTEVTTQLWASDAHHSVSTWLDTRDSGQVHDQAYTPYGFSSDGATVGFNAQWRDPVTGWYHLGTGYRVYNPSLKIFLQPDAWSPFTSGEINPYAYCLGNPINRADPSGHFSWRSFIQILVGVSVAVGIAVFTGGVGLVAGMAIGAAVNVGVGVAYDLATGTTPTLKSIASDAFIGAAGGVAGHAVGGAGKALAGAAGSVTGKIAQAVTYEIGTNLVTLPGTILFQTIGRAVTSAVANNKRGAQTQEPFLATTAGYLAELPMEKLRRQQRSAPPPPSQHLNSQAAGYNETSSDPVSARISSRETVTAEDVRSNSFGESSTYGGSQFSLLPSPVHRVSFTIDPKARTM